MKKDMLDDKVENITKPKIATLQELIDNIEAKKSGTKVKSSSFSNPDISCDAVAVVHDDNYDNDFIGANADVCSEDSMMSHRMHKTSAGRTKGKRQKTQDAEERFTTADQVYNYALSLLTFRDYSKAEMLSKLIKKGASENFYRSAMAKLLEYNFLNEERYAFRVYEMWLEKRIYGRSHLQAELKKRNIEADAIAKVMEAFTVELETSRAENAAELFMQQNRKKLQELKQFDIEDADDSCEECISSLQSKSSFRAGKFSSKSAKRYAARQKLQAAAGRFMAARGFSGRYMHILLNKLHCDNDM